MTYKIVRVAITSMGGFSSHFKAAQNEDIDFEVQEYPEMNDYINTMEERGWTVVDVAESTAGNVSYYLYFTLHRDDTP